LVPKRGVQIMLKAPFPYFGGKSLIAAHVWAALGQPDHYLEPFFGSGAVLLARPNWQPTMTETVNDKDGFVCNVWRALQTNPDEVARWCDWPVNHVDLMARKKELIKNKDLLLEGLSSDPKWCDPVLAGYWIWAASCWIGSGLTSPGQRPHLSTKGMGVHSVSLGQIPHLGNKGMGVHSVSLGKRPHLSAKGMGVQEPYNVNIYSWFRQLSERLRNVRVVCGEWDRICGGNWQGGHWKDVGVFFDPPYGVEDRADNIYHCDSTTVAKDVREWCKERGKNKNYRIVLAGYEEHEELLSLGWTIESWKTSGGYGNTKRRKKTGRGQENRKREMLYFSPACRHTKIRSLF
jgi:site-specific DNA-adenine methylase